MSLCINKKNNDLYKMEQMSSISFIMSVSRCAAVEQATHRWTNAGLSPTRFDDLEEFM